MALFVDISVFNALNIDWQAYKAWSKQSDGVSRISMRSSYGTGYVDQHFQAYRAGALAAGIDSIIYYHYAYPQFNTGTAEADWQHSVIGDIRPTDVMMLDYEENVSQATAAWAYEWLARQEANYKGQLPTIYASDSYVRQRLQDARLTRYPLTLANWQFDPAARPPCPPPWQAYTYLQYTDRAQGIPGVPGSVDADVYIGSPPAPVGGSTSAPLNAHGEVADFADVSQFQPATSEFACAEYAIALVKFAGAPGHGPSGTVAQITAFADSLYTKYIGPDVLSNLQGTTNEIMQKILADIGLTQVDILAITPTTQQASDLALIQASLAKGCPIIAVVKEDSIIDLDLGKNPYSWGPSGTHVVVYSGIASDGNILVRDTANIIGPLQVNNTVRPGPRRYDRNKIATQWAVAVHMPSLTDAGGETVMPTDFKAQAAQDCWNSTASLFGGTAPRYNSGIAKAWQALFATGKKPGPPLSQEYGSVDWNGKPIRVQEFINTRCEWWNGQAHWYPQL